MRDEFRGYYPPTDDEMKAIWDDGLVILDTNALLNLFRYSASAREDFFKALRLKESSLWIPHQVGFEFQRRRIEVVNAQSTAFDEIEASLTKAKHAVEAALGGYKRHPSLDTTSMTETLTRSIEELSGKLSEARQVHASDVVERKTNEQTFEAITSLYLSKVGPAFAPERLQAIYKDGESRYEKSIPPGYKDKHKDAPARYGDLVLWEQILEHAREVKRPAIFVTDDQKEDWWYIVDSQTYGARPELVDEYYAAAEARVHFLSPNRFLAFAQARGSEISAESLQEVEQVSTAQPGAAVSEKMLQKLMSEQTYLIHRLNKDKSVHHMRGRYGPVFDVVLDRVDFLRARIASTEEALEDIDRSLRSGESAIPDILPEVVAIREEQARYYDELEVVLERLEMLKAKDRHPSSSDNSQQRENLRRLREIHKQLREGDFNDDDAAEGT